MSKYNLPSITTIENVLDLLTNPEKYIAYLKEFKATHAEVVNALGLLDTKSKVDAAMSAALDQQQAVKQASAKETARLAAIMNALDDREAKLAQHEAEFKQHVTNTEHELARAEAERVKRYAELQAFVNSTNAYLTAQQEKLDTALGKLAVDQEKTAILKAKFEHAAQALGMKVE